ncbi:MAG: hypothetical protein AVDCRST_MAG33-971, partial [uncultured Thermomicrobiales bacterium]
CSRQRYASISGQTHYPPGSVSPSSPPSPQRGRRDGSTVSTARQDGPGADTLQYRPLFRCPWLDGPSTGPVNG